MYADNCGLSTPKCVDKLSYRHHNASWNRASRFLMSKDESRPIYLRAKVLNRGTRVPFVVNVFSSVTLPFITLPFSFYFVYLVSSLRRPVRDRRSNPILDASDMFRTHSLLRTVPLRGGLVFRSFAVCLGFVS